MTSLADTLAKRASSIDRTVDVPRLVEALELLDTMEGIDEIKETIHELIKWTISVKPSEHKNQIYHTMITGPPGTGKTMLAGILGKVYIALGVIQAVDAEPSASEGPSGAKESLMIKLGESITNNTLFMYDEELSGNGVTFTGATHCNECKYLLDNIESMSNAYYINRKRLKSTKSTLRELYTIIHNLVGRICPGDNTRYTLIGIKRNLYDAITGCNHFNFKYVENEKGVKEKEKPRKSKLKYTVASRQDFVAQYVGQTAPKTKKLLDSARPGVLFIDEAYSLCNDPGTEGDSFGSEALTVINQYMTEHPDLVVIFAGYTKKIEKGLFTVQEGLERRIMYHYTMPEYSEDVIKKIIVNRFTRSGWEFTRDSLQPVTDNKIKTPGNIEQFITACKMIISASVFSEWEVTGEQRSPSVDSSTVVKALRKMSQKPETRSSMSSMYM